jgi:hypothetical protein
MSRRSPRRNRAMVGMVTSRMVAEAEAAAVPVELMLVHLLSI